MAAPRKTLADLLADADAREPSDTSIDATALAQRARLVATSRRGTRRLVSGATAAVLFMLLSGVGWKQWNRPQAPVAVHSLSTPQTDPIAARAELTALREESRRREALVDRLLSNERRRLAIAELRHAR